MSDYRQLQEDRALRDVAKELVSRDVANLKGDVKEQGVAKRTMHRLREGAEGVVDETDAFVRENSAAIGGVAALGVGLALLWIFRDSVSEFYHKAMIATGLEHEPTWREKAEHLVDKARSLKD